MGVARPVGNTTLLVRRSLNRNRAMILRELHIDERKLHSTGREVATIKKRVMLLFEFSLFTRDRRQYVHESLRDGIYLKKR